MLTNLVCSITGGRGIQLVYMKVMVAQGPEGRDPIGKIRVYL